ncbi:hypothetical protein ACHAXR_007418 [Thalassiosira sp. AJA248-18]
MPPFRSQRFDPYGEGANTNNTLNANAPLPQGTTRQRTLVGNGRLAESNGRAAAGRGHTPASPAYQGGTIGGNGVRRQQPHSGGGNIHNRIIGGHQDGTPHRYGHGGIDDSSRGFPQGHNAVYTNSYAERGHSRGGRDESNHHDHGGNGVVMGTTGAAPLNAQIHPLMEARKRPKQPNAGAFNNPYNPYSGDASKGGGSRVHQPPFPPTTTASNFLSQTRRILSLLLGQVPEEDLLALQKQQQYGLQASSEEEILLKLLSAKSTVRILRLFLLIPLLIFGSRRFFPPLADRITRPKVWRWSAGVTMPGQKNVASRNLAGRNCVMNYFIEKQPPDEYDPDFVPDPKPGEKNKDGTPKTKPPVKIIEGTYRTKGQVHVISRFVEAVADSFRSNTGIRQHIIFAETRDSGHLAYEAMRHWPPRGKHRTTVHVISSDELPNDKAGRNAAKALGYGSLEDIEERFKGNDKARIYDRDGNIAGLSDMGEDMDDDEVLQGMEVDVPDRETLEFRMKSGKNRRMKHTNTTLLPDGTRPYPNLRALLPFEEEDEGDGEILVPYLHVDGMSMTNQMIVLESARSLLEENRVVAVGVEHSPDMDVRVLIAFFEQVRYKTFFLGARQVARIDNLCDEVLDDVLDHPSVSLPKGNWFRRLFIHLGLISKAELRISGDKKTPEGPKQRETPPFFVAMPRGRRSKEEMTIQHMYDLFGGYGGGGGQIKTANDRKAPGK